MMNPKVSIIIPYNKDRGWLDKAIESVYNQTYKGQIELIESKSNNGVSYNINRGVERATGDFIKYFAEDDILTNNCIQDSVKAMGKNDFIHGKAINFFKSGLTTKHIPKIKYPTLKQLVDFNHLHGGTMFYRRDVFERFGMFDEKLWTAEEYEFHLRIISKGALLGYCDSFLYKYRRHDNQKSIGKHNRQAERQREIKRIKEKYV